jgi:hypothetical protein
MLDYRIGQGGGLDDTGQALSVAYYFERQGKLSDAATTAEGVLKTRIKFAVAERSPACAGPRKSN